MLSLLANINPHDRFEPLDRQALPSRYYATPTPVRKDPIGCDGRDEGHAVADPIGSRTARRTLQRQKLSPSPIRWERVGVRVARVAS